jgi:hypothetical protein
MNQVETKQAESVISGIWKFSDRVPVETIIKVAEEFFGDMPSSYQNLHIRKCSKNQYGISFIYDCGEDVHDRTVYNRFFSRITDTLKRRFGNDFVGWDVTSDVFIVRNKPQGINLDELQRETQRLLNLLKNREPGLMTWNTFLRDQIVGMRSMLADAF